MTSKKTINRYYVRRAQDRLHIEYRDTAIGVLAVVALSMAFVGLVLYCLYLLGAWEPPAMGELPDGNIPITKTIPYNNVPSKSFSEIANNGR